MSKDTIKWRASLTRTHEQCTIIVQLAGFLQVQVCLYMFIAEISTLISRPKPRGSTTSKTLLAGRPRSVTLVRQKPVRAIIPPQTHFEFPTFVSNAFLHLIHVLFYAHIGQHSCIEHNSFQRPSNDRHTVSSDYRGSAALELPRRPQTGPLFYIVNLPASIMLSFFAILYYSFHFFAIPSCSLLQNEL